VRAICQLAAKRRRLNDETMNAMPAQSPARAVVFAYHDIGVRCLEALLELGVEIGLVVTHTDQPSENIWFASVAAVARKNNIPVITPEDPNTAEIIRQVAAAQPQFLFSFYYRSMLGAELLNIPSQGAFNLHGSLLPRYRGRVPLNWAIIKGEQETGVSFHRMAARPDAGNLVAQQSLPILLNDTALDVFRKLVCAAEQLILQAVPKLIDGSAQEQAQDLSQGSYFGGRRLEDGNIDWSQPARQIHDLIRAVAPPYPGAFFDIGQQRVFILGSYYRALPARSPAPCIYWQDGQAWADCTDGRRLLITAGSIDDAAWDEGIFRQRFGDVLMLAKQAG